MGHLTGVMGGKGAVEEEGLSVFQSRFWVAYVSYLRAPETTESSVDMKWCWQACSAVVATVTLEISYWTKHTQGPLCVPDSRSGH